MKRGIVAFRASYALPFLLALWLMPALETSVLLLLQPMLTTIWAWLLFSELLSAAQIAGMALVLAGVAWLSASGVLE